MITKPPRYNPEHVGERDTTDPRYRSNERVPFEFKRWTDPAELDAKRVESVEEAEIRRQAQKVVR